MAKLKDVTMVLNIGNVEYAVVNTWDDFDLSTEHGRRATHKMITKNIDRAMREHAAGFDRRKWALACKYMRGDVQLKPAKRREKLNDEVWDLQDGYGQPGHTPEQGWDWSGIRDSSPEAKVAMIKVVEKFVGVL